MKGDTVIGFTGRGSEPPCFCVTFIQKSDGTIDGVFPTGSDVGKVMAGGKPITVQSLIARSQHLWQAPSGLTLSTEKSEIGFAFGKDDFFIGTKSGLLAEVNNRLSGKLDENTRFILNEVRQSLELV